MKSIAKYFIMTYIEDVCETHFPDRFVADPCSLDIVHQVRYYQRWEGFDAFKIDMGRVFTGYNDGVRRSLDLALEYKSGGIPLSQVQSIEVVIKGECYN